MNRETDQKAIVFCIAKDILKNITIALALSISFAFIGFMIAKIQYKPTYTSSTTFVVSEKGSRGMAYSNMVKAQEMISSFRTIMNSNVLGKKVCQDMKVDSLPGTISVEVVPETNLLTMSVT